MKIEDQVCSLELAKKLKELGVKQESLFYWNEYVDVEPRISRQESPGVLYKKNHFSAFTVAELGRLLLYFPYPFTLETKWYDYGGVKNKLLFPRFRNNRLVKKRTKIYIKLLKFEQEMCELENMIYTEANARAAMLIYLLENKLLPINQ